MNGFRIREARPVDRTAVGRLWVELMAYHRALDPRFVVAADGEQKYIRHVHEMMRSRDARVIVAEAIATGEIVAYILGEIQVRPPMALPGVYGFVSDIYVQDDWRRHGVGQALFEHLKLWFVSRRASAIELYIADSNPAAGAFWRAMGLAPLLILLHIDL